MAGFGGSQVLKAGVPVDIVNPKTGYDLVLTAAGSGNAIARDALELLQDKGVDIFASIHKESKYNILHLVICHGSYESFEFILDQLVQRPETFRKLVFAKAHNDYTVFEALAKRSGWWFSQPAARLKLFLEKVKGFPEVQNDLQILANVRNKQNESPLGMTREKETIGLLLQARADPRKVFLQFSGKSFTSLSAVDMLLEARADINILAEEDAARKATPVQLIIANGDLPLVEECIKRGADVHVKDGNGESSISYCNHPYMIKFLTDLCCDVNFQSHINGDTLLHSLCAKGNTSMVKYVLIELRAKALVNFKNYSLLHMAALHSRVDTMKFLIEQGFDLLATDRERQTPLHLACKVGLIYSVKLLLEEGTPVDVPDEIGETPFLENVRQGNMDVFELLLSFRADASAKTKNGQTALHLTAAAGNKSVLRRLLKFSHCDIDVNAQTRDTGATAFHMAVESMNDSIVELLLTDKRVQHDLLNEKEESPLDIAARGATKLLVMIVNLRVVQLKELQRPFLEAVTASNQEACEYLVCECGVEPRNCKDASGNNALHILARTGDDALARWVLLHWGADLKEALVRENHEGMTPKDVAEVRDNERVARAFNVQCRHTMGETLFFQGPQLGISELSDAPELDGQQDHCIQWVADSDLPAVASDLRSADSDGWRRIVVQWICDCFCCKRCRRRLAQADLPAGREKEAEAETIELKRFEVSAGSSENELHYW